MSVWSRGEDKADCCCLTQRATCPCPAPALCLLMGTGCVEEAGSVGSLCRAKRRGLQGLEGGRHMTWEKTGGLSGEKTVDKQRE